MKKSTAIMLHGDISQQEGGVLDARANAATTILALMTALKV